MSVLLYKILNSKSLWGECYYKKSCKDKTFF